MSAETLRRAAALMRDRAEAATRDVCPEWTRQAVRHIARNCMIECSYSHGDESPPTVPHDHDGDSEATWDRHDDAEHIASWHPTVALAVADWLSGEAAHYARYYPNGHRDGELDTASRHALTIARAYLGES